MSWKEWDQGEVVEAGDLQEYIQDQVVQNYADSAARSTALGTAVAEGMVSYLQDSNSVEVYDGSAWVSVANDLSSGTAGYTALSNGTAGLSYQPVSHNYIINGAFDIWQRGDTVTHSESDTSTSGYTADRFIIANVEDGIAWRSITVSKSTNAPQGFDYSAKVTTGDNSVNRAVVNQKIEDVAPLDNQELTLSFYIKRLASVNGNPDLNINAFGSTQTLGDFSLVSNSTFERFTATFTTSVTSAQNSLRIEIRNPSNIPLLSTAGDLFEITGVQLEAGSIATPFKRNANSIAGELAACQRYYQQIDGAGSTSFAPFVNGNIHGSTEFRGILTFNNMRTPPTIAAAAAGTYNCIAGGAGVGVSSFAFGTIGTNTARVIANLSGSKTVGHGGYITANADGDSAFTLSAEL